MSPSYEQTRRLNPRYVGQEDPFEDLYWEQDLESEYRRSLAYNQKRRQETLSSKIEEYIRSYL